MRRFAFTFLLLAACGSSTPEPKWPASPCRIETFEGSRFTICDPKGGQLMLVAAGKDEVPKRSFAEVMADIPVERVAFAMNAGMFDENGRPIGLAIAGRRQVHAINLKDGPGNFHLKPNGVFSVAYNGAARIAPSGPMTAIQRAQTVELATQSGPMLVIDGQLHPKLSHDGQSRHIRNGVGVRGGRALFVISNEVVSMGKFARFFRDHLNTPNALFFDGSVSSLWDPANGRQDAGVPLGPIIVAMKPAPATQPAASAPGRASRATP